ncbi:hypothetical protein GCM10023331_11670 [Algivirga pacifica]|uniref:Gingipain domain-containing protein n=2 Tax=Algivirga pacifica TaxID=1162670 RepID=A0ABP9D898_9BACT
MDTSNYNWMNKEVPHLKITVKEDGIYKVTGRELEEAGYELLATKFSELKMLYRGKEVAIKEVDQNGDDIVNESDYFLFYGQKNDGALDKVLFTQDGGEPVNPYQSMYGDESAYFLVKEQLGEGEFHKRIKEAAPITGPTAAPEHILKEQLHSFRDRVVQGIDVFAEPGYGTFGSSRYEKKEGFVEALSKGGTIEKRFILPNIEESLLGTENARLETNILPVLRAENYESDIQLQVEEGTTISTRKLIKNRSFLIDTPLSRDWISNGTLRLVIKDGNHTTGDKSNQFSAAYYKITYPLASVQTNEGDIQMVLAESTTAYHFNVDKSSDQTVVWDVTDPLYPQPLFRDEIQGNYKGRSHGAIFRQVIVSSQAREVSGVVKADFVDYTSDIPYNYFIITHDNLLEYVDEKGKVHYPVNEYVKYREGTGYQVLKMTIEEVYNTFSFGERTPYALKAFARMVDRTFRYETPPKLFIIGKGISLEEDKTLTHPDNLIPPLGIPASDNNIVATHYSSSYTMSMAVGRLSAVTPQQVKSYLDKVNRMESSGFKPSPGVQEVPGEQDLWRKNTLLLAGGYEDSLLIRERDPITGEPGSNGKRMDKEFFVERLQQYASYIQEGPLGGVSPSLIIKSSSSNTTELIDVSKQINQGVGLLIFFGHASIYGPDLDIGRVERGYENEGRYPVILMNGCSGGDVFRKGESWAENWILADKKGAVLFISKNRYSFPEQADEVAGQFFNHTYGSRLNQGTLHEDDFGSVSAGEKFRRAIEEYTSWFNIFPGFRALDYISLEQMVFQGDPALVITPRNPSVAIKKDEFELLPTGNDLQVSAQSNSFAFEFPLYNFGKVPEGVDSVTIEIERVFPDPSLSEIIRFRKKIPRNVSQERIVWDNTFGKPYANGVNKFTVRVDPPVRDVVLNNNAITDFDFYYSFPENTLRVVAPFDHAILNQDSLTVWIDDLNPKARERNYTLTIGRDSALTDRIELDTTGFDMLSWKLDVKTFYPSLKSGDVVYLYADYSTYEEGDLQGGDTVSVTYEPTLAKGWKQTVAQQAFADSAFTNLTYQSPSFFVRGRELTLDMYTSSIFGADWNMTYEGAPLTGNEATSAARELILLGVSATTGGYYFPNYNIWGKGLDRLVGFKVDERDQTVRGPMVRLNQLDLVGQNSTLLKAFVEGDSSVVKQDGDYVVLLSRGGIDMEQIVAYDSAGVLTSLGFDTNELKKVKKNAFIGVGRRGMLRSFLNRSDTLMASGERAVEASYTIVTVPDSGSVKSEWIGPARQWETLEFEVAPGDRSDDWELVVYGKGDTGVVDSLGTFTADGRIGLNEIYQQYPYLRLEWKVGRPAAGQQSSQLRDWKVTYASLPEGALYTEKIQHTVEESYLNKEDAYYQGEDLRLRYVFRLLTEEKYEEALPVFYSLKGKTVETDSIPASVWEQQDSVHLKVNVDTWKESLLGGNSLFLTAGTPDNEVYFFNNVREYAFHVEEDKVNPLLEVFLDGRRILDGDIISPKAELTISLRDDNPFLRLSENTASVKMKLRSQATAEEGGEILLEKDLKDIGLVKSDNKGNNQYTASFNIAHLVADQNNDVSNLRVVEGEPLLKDGEYQLSIEATDVNGNYVGGNLIEQEIDTVAFRQSYKVAFTVNTEEAVTNFYPYPNPFSDNVRFVFTLTGTDIPEEIKIQIMTVTGRVVREITQEELGPVHIGNNISRYAWDGTDEFGDRLANGVYLYRVIVKKSGEVMKKSDIDKGNDGLFKHNIGKLYLMR